VLAIKSVLVKRARSSGTLWWEGEDPNDHPTSHMNWAVGGFIADSKIGKKERKKEK